MPPLGVSLLALLARLGGAAQRASSRAGCGGRSGDGARRRGRSRTLHSRCRRSSLLLLWRNSRRSGRSLGALGGAAACRRCLPARVPRRRSASSGRASSPTTATRATRRRSSTARTSSPRSSTGGRRSRGLSSPGSRPRSSSCAAAPSRSGRSGSGPRCRSSSSPPPPAPPQPPRRAASRARHARGDRARQRSRARARPEAAAVGVLALVLAAGYVQQHRRACARTTCPEQPELVAAAEMLRRETEAGRPRRLRSLDRPVPRRSPCRGAARRHRQPALPDGLADRRRGSARARCG